MLRNYQFPGMKLAIGLIVGIKISLLATQMSSCEGRKAISDPLSCASAACADKLEIFKAMRQQQPISKAKAIKDSSRAENTITTEPVVPASDAAKCPLDRAELGQYTWGLLHTIAANYPESPTVEEKQQAYNLIIALSILYPCPVCAKDFRENILLSPPRYCPTSL